MNQLGYLSWCVCNTEVIYWMDNKITTRNNIQKLCFQLADNQEYPWI